MRNNRDEVLEPVPAPPAGKSGASKVFGDKREIRIFALLFVVFAFFVSIGPGRTQGARVLGHAHALLYEGRNAIDTYHWNTIDKACYGGHYFTSAGPGMGYLALGPLAGFEAIYSLIPQRATASLNQKMRTRLEQQERNLIDAGYLSFDPAVNRVDLFRFHASIWFFEFFVSLLMALGGVVFYRVLRLFEVEANLACNAALVLGVGTILFFYSRIPYAVAPSACLLLLAFYLVLLAKNNLKGPTGPNAARLLGSGLALGAAVAIEYIQIIGAVLVFLYAWKRLGSRRVWILGLGGLPVGLLIMWYHYASFGNPFAFPHQYLIPLFAGHDVGFLGLTHPSLERIASLAFGLRRGLFVYSPVLLFSLLLIAKGAFFKRQFIAEGMLVLGLLAGYIAFQASSPLVGETWGIGPRYAAATVPFLLLGVVFVRGPFERKTLYGLAFLSIFINWMTVQHDVEPMHSVNPLLDAMSAFLHSGPSSTLLEQALSLTAISSPLLTWAAGLGSYAVLAGIVWFIWRKTSSTPSSETAA